jgi:preprotein translocase SecF subunit
MKHRVKCYIISGVIILIGLISIALNGGLKYGIDFTGGLAMEIRPVPELSVTQVRDALARNGVTDAEIQELRSNNSFLIKTKSSEMIGDKIISIFQTEYPGHISSMEEFEVSRDEVGPRAGSDLRAKALNAVLVSLLFLLIYIWIRFRFTWGFICSFALLHDVIVTLGILSLVGKEIGMTVLAALLTIIGYSINNNIVLFDRIREDLKLYRKDTDYQIINRSINGVLNRTIITSFTTLLADIALLTFGGPVLHDFAFTFMIGILVGTVCSIFIASGLILDTVIALKRRKEATSKR